MLNWTSGCHPAATPACRWSSIVKRSGGIGEARVSPDGPFTIASWASSESGPVTAMFGVNAAPLVAVFGHGEAGDALAPRTLAAGVTVICELMDTFGLAWALWGISVTGMVGPVAGTGAVGPVSETESMNACGVTPAVVGGVTGAVVGVGAVVGGSGAGAVAVRMMFAISFRWVTLGSWLVSSVCQSLDRSTSVRSSELRVCAVVVTVVRNAE